MKHIRTTLGTILRTAEIWGYIEDSPVGKTRLPRRGPRPEKQVVTPDQLRSLLEKLPEPSKSLVWLLVLTGLRIGELLALRWQDVDLDAGVLRVRRTLYEGHFDEPKTRSSARTVLHHVLPDLVVPIDREYTQRFFGWQNPKFQYGQQGCFVQAFGTFAQIAREVNPLQFVDGGWNSSRTKVIDNAIVGLLRWIKDHDGVAASSNEPALLKQAHKPK